MSDYRKPSEIWIRRLPQNAGKKPAEKRSQKIELFPAYFWADKWQPGSPSFYPKLPLQSLARKTFWETHYRIRVNGVWVGGRARYVLFTKEQIREMYFK